MAVTLLPAIVDALHAVADCCKLYGTLTLSTMINAIDFSEKPEVFQLRVNGVECTANKRPIERCVPKYTCVLNLRVTCSLHLAFNDSY